VASPEDDDWQRARQEAAAALRDVLCWNLRPARWAQVRDVLAEMPAAAAAPGPAALWDATETLELYAPVRVETRLGDEPREPVPVSVREKVAELVDSLQPHGAGGPDGAGLPGGPGQAARRGA
jgi:hypothetical protein